jgi:hypothetical protein
MAELKKIDFAEQVLFEIRRIRKRLDTLENFVCSRIKTTDARQRSKGFVDPRDGTVYPIVKKN